MKATRTTSGVETVSERAVVMIPTLVQPAKPASTSTAALNAKILSDPKRFQRLARANTRRLTGKSTL